jgi:hypothetical protein
MGCSSWTSSAGDQVLALLAFLAVGCGLCAAGQQFLVTITFLGSSRRKSLQPLKLFFMLSDTNINTIMQAHDNLQPDLNLRDCLKLNGCADIIGEMQWPFFVAAFTRQPSWSAPLTSCIKTITTSIWRAHQVEGYQGIEILCKAMK